MLLKFVFLHRQVAQTNTVKLVATKAKENGRSCEAFARNMPFKKSYKGQTQSLQVSKHMLTC
jgi:hypothetical protein